MCTLWFPIGWFVPRDSFCVLYHGTSSGFEDISVHQDGSVLFLAGVVESRCGGSRRRLDCRVYHPQSESGVVP